ncbi:MAG: HAMP domain-containing histidine kinase [Zoogloeaceae bacterium]|nr:HAMP domain-containing histidine kinase [Zoogloeaceae bacterium]
MRQPRRQPFSRRLVLAFTLMTCVVSGTLSLGIVYAVYRVEEELVSRELDKTLHRVLEEDLRQGQPPQLDFDVRLFASHLPDSAIPPEFAAAEEGFSEMGDAYWVYAREIDGQRYILVQDQHEFEAREQLMFAVLFVSFLLTVASAWGLGKLMAKRVMAPIRRLAEQVREQAPLLPPVPPLAQDYADDEIGHLAAAFDDALQNLRLAMQRERLFTSDVSHELRTPLMVIANACELLETAHLTTREHDQLDRVSRAAEEMQSLVETFLMLARAQNPQGGTLVRESDLPLFTAAEEQARRWRPAFHAKGLTFDLLEAAPAPKNAPHYNAALLHTVLGNLLRNALHYTERGGARLVLEENGFRVEDSGSGIPEPEKEQVFLAFIRGSAARGEGLGLGLSLVKRICAHQGWQITLEDLPEGGSCFRVRLDRDAETVRRPLAGALEKFARFSPDFNVEEREKQGQAKRDAL